MRSGVLADVRQWARWPWFVAFAHFHRADAPMVADFQLLTWHLNTVGKGHTVTYYYITVSQPYSYNGADHLKGIDNRDTS